MQAPDPIEAALARLMPTALSVSGQRSIEEMLDGLAAELPVSPFQRYRRPLAGLAAAAAVAAMVAVPALLQPARQAATVSVTPPELAAAPGIVCLTDSDRVDSIAFEGRESAANGSAMKVMKARMVRERVVRDPEGNTILISEPREERVYVPVEAEESF